MNSATLAIRADANLEIGTGHMMRCLALAEAWRQAGGHAIFIMRHPSDEIVMTVETRGCEVVRLTGAEPAVRQGDACEAKETIGVCHDWAVDWVAVDGYQFDDDYLRRLRAAGLQLLAIDDLAHLPNYPVDVVVNQNLNATVDRYHALPETIVLTGPTYALLRTEFSSLPADRPIRARQNRLLVTLGGADRDNVTREVLRALPRIATPLDVQVLVGSTNPHYDVLREAVSGGGLHRIEFVRNPWNLPELMQWADVAVTAAGSTCWELARLGIPMILIGLNPRQREHAQAIARAGLGIDLGQASELDRARLACEMIALFGNPALRQTMSGCGRSLVDGRGAMRVVGTLLEQTVRLRPAQPEDCRLIWAWANDRSVRAASFNQDAIPWNEHVAWYRHRLQKTEAPTFVAVDGYGRPIGQIRLDRNGAEMLISLAVDPDRQRRGSGYRMLMAACRHIFTTSDAETACAYIKIENEPSLRLFARCGFDSAGFATWRDQPTMRVELHRQTWCAAWQAEHAEEPVPSNLP